ncbi:hypothetical protein E2C01_050565 [Portunus trituberculatus]|uniref:Uncharacterized protein n=1 Tax=Portunus trituberculatus TaxID=210409 RepID=A0A5B7G9C0_PORTR|nr:hypothetical protein [Portunus trituberculatus]
MAWPGCSLAALPPSLQLGLFPNARQDATLPHAQLNSVSLTPFRLRWSRDTPGDWNRLPKHFTLVL